jgi:hypothetical protein
LCFAQLPTSTVFRSSISGLNTKRLNIVLGFKVVFQKSWILPLIPPLRHKLERNIYFFVHAYASMMELQSLLKKKLIRQVAETESLIKPHCHFAVSTVSSRSNAFCSFMYDYLRQRGPTSSFNVNLLPFIFIGFSLRAIKQWNE